MITFLIVMHIIISLMLIGIVLVQSGKGGGLANAFGMGGGMGQSLFGVQTGNFLTRLTTVLAILFMVTSLSLAIFMGRVEVALIDREGIGEGWEESEPVERAEPELPEEN